MKKILIITQLVLFSFYFQARTYLKPAYTDIQAVYNYSQGRVNIGDVMNIYNFESISPFLSNPENVDEFNKWVQQEDVIAFLEREISDDNIIIYASLPFAFIHAVLIPNIELDESVIDDLLLWSHNPYSTWSLVVSSDDAWIEDPLAGAGSKTLKNGEQIVFIRSFEGVESQKRYFEIEQRISHVLGLHFMPERNAWCRLDQYGDIEDIVKIMKLDNLPGKEKGTIVTINRNILGEYTCLGNYSLCRMFDFTRYKREKFSRWPNNKKPIRVGNNHDLFSDLVVYEGYGSYSRGIQISNISASKIEIINRTWGRPSPGEEKLYVAFIAQDWKNSNVIKEISCDPKCLANYFTKSDLPFEITPAFFKPEVLLKYKSDREKYQLQERSITCRGGWYLKTFDINEAGQIHTYLGDLSQLPYEEQLHWKQYNEKPKAPISKRALAIDFEGQWYDEYNPLYSLKTKLRDLHKTNVNWWKLRGEEAIEKVLYPYTNSRDEWADEILNLDQLVVEGLEEKWLQQKAKELGRNPDPRLRALKLIEECLIGSGFEEDHAHKIMSSFHEIHNLRSFLKGHATGSEASEIRKKALEEYGSFRKHFMSLCANCDESLKIIIDVFKDQPNKTSR